MGRPKKEKELKHSNYVCVRLNDIELQIVNQAAADCGLSRPEYLRRLLLNKELQVHYEIVADIKDLKQLVSQYGKIGSNLNQIAKYFHTGGARSLAMEDEIRQCISELFTLRKEVLRLAGELNGNIKTHKK